jgi:hypothetical protein
MKQIVIIFLFVGSALNLSSSEEAFVFDREAFFSAHEENLLKEIWNGHKNNTTNQLVVWTTSEFATYSDIMVNRLTIADSLGIVQKTRIIACRLF